MPFGNKAGPSKVYAYGCRLESNIDEVYRQLRAANTYRNKLVELELERRRKVDELVAGMDSRISVLDKSIERLEVHLEECIKKIAAWRKQSGKKVAPENMRNEVKSLKSLLKSARDERKLRRKLIFESEKFAKLQKRVNDEQSVERKRARMSSNLYWGTYLTVEQSVGNIRSGAPPVFRRYNGNGKLALQLQKGLSWDAAIVCGDSRLRLEQLPTPKRKLGSNRDGRRYRAYVRIGSDDNRQPIFATVTVEIHRLPPPGASIKWVWLVAKRVATHTNWELQLVIEDEQGFPDHDHAAGGVVAVNLGWRNLNPDTRVVYWIGDDGQSGQMTLSSNQVRRLRKSEDLQSIRDKEFNLIRDKLSVWIKATSGLPDWFVERTKTIHAWRSQSRLAALAIVWRSQRFSGDALFMDVEAWRRQDKHLYEWQENNRRKYQAHRLHEYRVFARNLRRKYKTLLLPKVNWKQIQDAPASEDSDHAKHIRATKRIAAPSILTLALKNVYRDDVVEVSAKDITATCHVCGQPSGEIARAALIHECSNCGSSWDQDRNACENVFNASNQALCD